MMKKRMTELVSKFLSWLMAKNCSAVIETVKCRRRSMKTCTVTQMLGDTPLNTICYETFPASVSEEYCWVEVLKRKCNKKLLFDGFEKLGLGKADTLEELELKLEVCS